MKLDNKGIASAIIDYRNSNGRFWKRNLRELFYSGKNRNPELQQFRNHHISLLDKINGNTTKTEIFEMFNVS